MWKILFVAGVLLAVCDFSGASGETWYVDGSVAVSGNGLSWGSAFKTIQEGIDASSAGDTVIVAEGVYLENVRWPGNTIFEENFDAYTNLYTNDDVVGAGWKVVNGSGEANAAWRLWSATGDPLREQAPNLAGMTQNYMISDSDLAGGAEMDEELITPGINCRDWQNVRLKFNKNFRVYTEDTHHLQVAEVDIRVFEEAAGWGEWVSLLRYDATTVTEYDITPEDMDLSAYADQKNIQVRWRFYEAKFDWWFAIDDVTVSGEVIPKNITLRSTNPLDPVIVASTVIDGGGKGSAVAFFGTEDETCVLAGFTLRNGRAERGGGICGGTWPSWTHATIQNNVIVGNSARYGGGLAYCQGAVQNNVVAGNSADDYAGGLYDCDGSIQNNTIYGNSSASGCGGLAWCGGTIRNCVIWGNVDSFSGPQLADSVSPTYSCIQGWEQGGEGNISVHPHLVDPRGGDYHLQTWSPCVDAGDPSSDFSNEPPPNGGRINMGAYGNTPEAASASEDADGDSLPDDWEIHFFGDLAQGPSDDPDGDDKTNLDEYVHATNPAKLVTWYVDASVAVSGDGTSWATAFKTVQDGIDAASDGDTVIVRQGIYIENIRFNGKNIALTSTNPLDPDVVSGTIIDGNKAGSVVTFLGTEDETCVLSGFTIRNGEAAYEQGGYGGGICGGIQFRENPTHATIRNNVITGNSAYRGGGIALCDGHIVNNTITQNSAGRGGGLRYCYGIIENNVITGNSSTGEGAAGLDHCDGIIKNNVISGNSGLDSDGEGALAGCGGIIQNNLIIGNSSRGGAAGLSGCDGPILNNTIVGNSATGGEAPAGGLGGCGGIIRNCIIWGNTGPEGPQVGDCSEPAYSCIQDWSGGGVGNTNQPPLFVNAAGGDYRLQSNSPCIDKGVNYYWPAWRQCDLGGNCRLTGGRVDMGCYEYNSSPDSDGDLLSDTDESAAGADPANGDTDGDGLRDGLELLRGTDPLTPTPPEIIHVPGGLPAVQQALCLAANGDEIVVAPGTYRENLLFCGTNVVLRSSDPKESRIVASTILDGDGAGPVVSFTGRESEDCVLAGFTIRNGNAGSGAGIYGGGEGNPTHATIQNNTITGNSALRGGGGLAFCNGFIRNNVVSQNSAPWRGGGLYGCSGAVQGNIISGNSSDSGGGLYECNGDIRNNTIAGNSGGREGGGLGWCQGVIANCIIWGNTAGQGPQLYQCVEPSYSCIQTWTGGGKGNIAKDPGFVDVGSANFRLPSSSPCIDAGRNDPGLPDTDIAGMPRILYGGRTTTVDMGAFEFYINRCELGPQPDQATLTWSSVAGKSYSVFYTADLLLWSLADDAAPSAGARTTSWTDDGSKTGIPPSLVPRRFYRTVENP